MHRAERFMETTVTLASARLIKPTGVLSCVEHAPRCELLHTSRADSDCSSRQARATDQALAGLGLPRGTATGSTKAYPKREQDGWSEEQGGRARRDEKLTAKLEARLAVGGVARRRNP